MRHSIFGIVSLFCIITLLSTFSCRSPSHFRPETEEDWSEFMSDQNLVFNHPLKPDWGESLFIADGLTGASVYPLGSNTNSLRWELGRTDVSMERPIPDIHPIPERLPIGKIVLSTKDSIINSNMLLDLWNAEVQFNFSTASGEISGRSFVERTANTVIIEVMNPNNVAFDLSFEEEWSITPKMEQKLEEIPLEYLPPKPYSETRDQIEVVIQERADKGAHATAHTKVSVSEHTTVFFLAIGKHFSEGESAQESGQIALSEAVQKVLNASTMGIENLTKKHRERWHKYYLQAWVSLPDSDFWEKFYWIQIYKFASASHPNLPIVPDTMGPWYHATDWGATWWNLNTQLTYFPSYSGNRLDAGRSLITTINHFFEERSFAYKGDKNIITMGRNAPYRFINNWGTWELGNLTWVLHNYWKHWKYTMDMKLAEDLFPILKANMNYYLHVMIRDDEGKIHLPKMLSPEYSIPTEDKRAEDTNYSLQSFQWGLKTLLELDSLLEKNDPLKNQWEEALNEMIDLPKGKNGFDIALRYPYLESHRHYSHLLAIFPYQTIHPDDNKFTRDLISTSVNHWMSKKEHLSAYSYTGSAAMYAILEDGDRALNSLYNMSTAGINDSWAPITGVLPNTMYMESNNPVLESPLSVVESINFMLIQSSNGIIKVFPAIPSKWQEAHFQDLRAEGAFLVSADYINGKTQTIQIKSLAGQPCILEIRMDDFQIVENVDFKLIKSTKSKEIWKIDLKKNQTINIVRKV